MDVFNLPAPVLLWGFEIIPNVSSNYREFHRPWTFHFLNPEQPRAASYYFTGADFYQQHHTGKTLDMTVASGGDTFDLCGSEAYRKFSVRMDSVMGAGYYRHDENKRYVAQLDDPPEGEEGPGVFNGLFLIETEETLHVDELGVPVLQERVVEPERTIIYEWLNTEASGAPPNFAAIGGSLFAEEITIGYLEGVGNQWQSAVEGGPSILVDAGVPQEIYHRSSSNTGKWALIQVGVMSARTIDSNWPVFEPEDPVEYTLEGIGVTFEIEARSNKPVVYEEAGPGIIGNAIYGNGKATQELLGLIDAKKWKDEFGIFDQVQEALDEVPWQPTLTYAGRERDGFGRVSRGRFISMGGTYRVTLRKEETEEAAIVLVVGPDEPVNYSFPLATTEEEEFWTDLMWVEKPDGEGGWTLLPPETYWQIVSGQPGPGVRLIHWRRGRVGYRWGHWVFTEPPPEYPTPGDEPRYRLKVHTKNARP